MPEQGHPAAVRFHRHAGEAMPANAYILETPGGPVPAYLTMRGNGRIVELGAFLTADERQHLHDELRARLHRRKGSAAPPAELVCIVDAQECLIG